MPDIACPTLPDRYEPVAGACGSLLGSGGMADVFRARDRLTGDEVAIKIIRAEVMVEEDFRSRFEREVMVSASVHHPHLVPLHDLGELDDGRPYLALALANAGSLLELRRTHPAWPLLARLLDQTLSALACLHARGILHHDVKLSNVLLHREKDGTLSAWLADLGLAKALGDREHFTGTLAGTLAYMPWEILTRTYAEICPASDLFAVGVLIFRLVTGTNPFPEQRWSEQVARRASPPRALPIRKGLVVPEGLEDIVFTLLQRDPRARLDLASDLRSALAALTPASPLDEPGLDDGGGGLGPSPGLLSDFVTTHGLPFVGRPLSPALPRHDIPPWHRPPPPPIPFRPSLEPGRNAKARASLGLFSLREIPLVGRHEERQRIWNHARSVASTGRPVALVIEGEAGVGKSRLLRSVLRPLEEAGQAESVEVRFTPGHGSADGYSGAVRRLLRLDDADLASTNARLERWIARDTQRRERDEILEARLLARWACPAEAREPVSNAVAREHLFKHLQRRAWRGLSILVIEDAHWCETEDDGPTLAATALQLCLPVLAIVTCRSNPTDTHPMASSSLQALLSLGADRLVLERLPPAQVHDMIEECLPLEASLQADIVRRSAGNPLFAMEITRRLCKEALLRPIATEPRGRAPGEVGLRYGLIAPAMNVIPEDIRTLFESRITSMLGRARDRVAANFALDVLGVTQGGLPWRVLEHAAGAGLRALVDAGLVREQDGLALLDHLILGQILEVRVRGREAAVHAALAEAWRREAPDPHAWRALGHHELRAGRPEQAIDPFLRAIEGSWVMASVGELRSMALDLNDALKRTPPRDDARVLAQLAMARTDRATGHRMEALRRIERLRADVVPSDLAIEVTAQYVETLEQEARARLGIPALDEVEPLFKSSEPRSQARFLQVRALCLLTLGRHGAAERQVRRALGIAQGDAQKAELLEVLGTCLESSDPEGAFAVLTDAAQLASATGHRSLQAQVAARKARLLGVQGLWEEGQALSEEAERLALASGFHSVVPLCRNARAECLRFQGRLREADALYAEGRRWAVATDQKAWVYAFDLNLALCALIRREREALERRLSSLAEQADPRWEPYAPAVAGLEAAARLLADPEGPLGLSEAGLGRLLGMGLDGAFTGALLALLLEEAGRGEEAHAIEEGVRRSMREMKLTRQLLEPMTERFLAARAPGRG